MILYYSVETIIFPLNQCKILYFFHAFYRQKLNVIFKFSSKPADEMVVDNGTHYEADEICKIFLSL
jgi:hypothetical protein